MSETYFRCSEFFSKLSFLFKVTICNYFSLIKLERVWSLWSVEFCGVERGAKLSGAT